MKRTTPFQCFRKPAPKAAAASASGDTLQTDDRNVNIIETTENEPEADTIPRGTENEANAIITLEYTLLWLALFPNESAVRTNPLN